MEVFFNSLTIVIKIKYLINFVLSINLIMFVIKIYVKVMADSEKHALVAEKQAPKRGRGRPKCFDEQQALQKAMLLFWEYGYESTSMSDLTKALNLTAPSIYSSFGDKSQLFHACLEYYLKHEACPLEVIFQQAKTAKIAIEIYLYENLKKLVQQNKPTGCMLVTATMNCSQEHAPIQHDLLLKRQQVKENIYQRLQQGVKEGDLNPRANIQAMTDYYSTVIQGLTMQARDGVSAEQLQSVVTLAIKTWELF
jgi:AcrR family transcriptional regulator